METCVRQEDPHFDFSFLNVYISFVRYSWKSASKCGSFFDCYPSFLIEHVTNHVVLRMLSFWFLLLARTFHPDSQYYFCISLPHFLYYRWINHYLLKINGDTFSMGILFSGFHNDLWPSNYLWSIWYQKEDVLGETAQISIAGFYKRQVKVAFDDLDDPVTFILCPISGKRTMFLINMNCRFYWSSPKASWFINWGSLKRRSYDTVFPLVKHGRKLYP